MSFNLFPNLNINDPKNHASLIMGIIPHQRSFGVGIVDDIIGRLGPAGPGLIWIPNSVKVAKFAANTNENSNPRDKFIVNRMNIQNGEEEKRNFADAVRPARLLDPRKFLSMPTNALFGQFSRFSTGQSFPQPPQQQQVAHRPPQQQQVAHQTGPISNKIIDKHLDSIFGVVKKPKKKSKKKSKTLRKKSKDINIGSATIKR